MISRRRVLAGLALGTDRGAYLRQLLGEGGEVTIPTGLHLLDLAGPDDSLMPRPGATVRFEPGAVIRFRNLSDRYVPAISVVQAPGVTIQGARFEWAGELKIGPDFPQPDPSFTPMTPRLGSASPYYGYMYCAAVCVLESREVSIRDFAGHSLQRDPSGAIHAWITASRTDGLIVEDVRGDDCCLVVLTQGGEGGAFRRIRGGRMCQDIGIPGHVLYTYLHGCTIEDIEDEGIETGRKRRIGHTVSAANGAMRIRGIRSKRATGPLNVKLARDGGEISDIDWSCFGVAPLDLGGRVDKLYFVAGSGNTGLRLSNISLHTDLDDAYLVGGELAGSRIVGLALERRDIGAAKYGFLRLKGRGIEIAGRMSQTGRGPARLLSPREGALELALTVDLSGRINPGALQPNNGRFEGRVHQP